MEGGPARRRSMNLRQSASIEMDGGGGSGGLGRGMSTASSALGSVGLGPGGSKRLSRRGSAFVNDMRHSYKLAKKNTNKMVKKSVKKGSWYFWQTNWKFLSMIIYDDMRTIEGDENENKNSILDGCEAEYMKFPRY